MTYQYQADFDLLGIDCPPAEYQFFHEKAFRFTTENMKDQDNFIPQYHKNPRRFNSQDDIQKCKAMALSLFDTQEHAEARFKVLKSTIGRKIYQIIGTHLAEGSILEEHGVQSPVDKRGHFSQHVVDELDFSDHFTVITEL